MNESRTAALAMPLVQNTRFSAGWFIALQKK